MLFSNVLVDAFETKKNTFHPNRTENQLGTVLQKSSISFFFSNGTILAPNLISSSVLKDLMMTSQMVIVLLNVKDCPLEGQRNSGRPCEIELNKLSFREMRAHCPWRYVTMKVAVLTSCPSSSSQSTGLTACRNRRTNETKTKLIN